MISRSPEKNFKQVFESNVQPMLLIDSKLELLFAANNAAVTVLGFSAVSLRKMILSDIIKITDEQKQSISLNCLLEQNQPYKTSFCFISEDKNILCFGCTVVPVCSQDKKLVYYLITIDAVKPCRQNKIFLTKNLALKEIISQIEQEKDKVKQDIIGHIEQEILPLLGKLALKGRAEKYIMLIRKHLTELNSSLRGAKQDTDFNFTPREAEISRLIRDGLTSKEISQLLNITSQTIDKHRQNIRKKLGIDDQTINLTSYLSKI